MVVSDPCYKLGTWCAGELHGCLPGEWEAMIGISDEGKFGKRVAMLVVLAKGQAKGSLNVLKSKGSCASCFHEIEIQT